MPWNGSFFIFEPFEGCSAVSDANGKYKMTFKLDKCGTTLTQEDGKLVFANRVEPNKAAATTSGIIMTMPLGFDVRCNYEDNFDLTIDDLYIDDDVIDTGDEDGVIDGEGDFSNYFSISAYSQSDYTDDITEQNRISIGAPVYLEIKENKAIPNNLEFFLKDCTGYTDIDDPTTYADSSFQFVQVNVAPVYPEVILVSPQFTLDLDFGLDQNLNFFRTCVMQIWWAQPL